MSVPRLEKVDVNDHFYVSRKKVPTMSTDTQPLVVGLSQSDASEARSVESATARKTEKKQRSDTNGKNSASSSSGDGPSLLVTKKRKREPGIVYISRIPPRMNRAALRRYFDRFGQLGRLHIQDESGAGDHRRNRRSSTPASSGVPTSGWLEFLDKRVARRVSRLLNGQPIGSAKRKSRWREDLWCLTYLKGFSWQQLIEEKVYKHRVREARLNAALNEVKRQNSLYLELVDEQKRFLKMEEKRAGKRTNAEGERQEDSDKPLSLDAAERAKGTREGETEEGKHLKKKSRVQDPQKRTPQLSASRKTKGASGKAKDSCFAGTKGSPEQPFLKGERLYSLDLGTKVKST
ncbi:pre-rRNA-processing protein, putative [Toxoplasma gondii ME49]|uniref:Pre-rRNA-processing protein, putative n=2 Tax=Toxoplasma gondii TaxID=5811 RepID=S8F7Y7_TOXGM|nr:pre-rRNA-processing protein, putative [Toxoplasma gondii ME49]EPT31996.1 pre-rRNA-processing protein, putative [Toxoplasma gondii ME49]KYF42652.1 RRM domain containing protein [Toxoplasma gondii ARI]|eukprot:XP_018638275.1 pre-rRNA-processing protein, putative [Toxoplasma gondii ME49]